MGLIDRLRRITRARIEAFLDTVETPETVLPQLVEELGDKVEDAARAEAKALSAVKAAQRRLDEATGRADRMERGARLAMRQKDEETARKALAAQIESERKAETCRRELEGTEKAYREAGAVRRQLQQDLEDLRSRSRELIARSRRAHIRKDQSLASGASKDESILDAVARMEARVDEMEAEVEVADEVAQTLGASFELERVEQLERDAEVEERLRQLQGEIEDGE
jgi:phage shock protein A